VSAALGSAIGGEPREMRWWGWGHHERRVPLTRELGAFLADTLGIDGTLSPPVALADVRLPNIELTQNARVRLEQIVGPAWVRSDDVARITHGAGKSYLDLVRMRAGTPEGAPDAVVSPASHDEVLAVLAACAQERIAVVPFGGGTSIVGGLAPLRGDQHAVISLDLGRLSGLLADRQRRGGHARAGARSMARRARPDARPLPRQLRVLLDRRLRRDAVGRAGLERLRAH